MPGADAFYAQAAGRGDLFAGAVEPAYSPLGGDFLAGSPLAGLALQFGAPALYGGAGFLGGQFLPTQNLYAQIQARQYQAARLQALQAGFSADKASYVDIMKGLARMTGTPFGLEQARAADVIAGDVAALMPFVAPMMPGLADQLHGPAGSRGLLADAVFRRGLHEVDPVTGMVGLSPATAAARARGIYSELYERGAPGSGLAAARGLGAGSAGQLYAELERMGIAGPTAAALPGLRAQAGALDALNPGAGIGRQALESFDAKQAAGRIKQLAGAVSAMRDLFGDNGHPDAPMPVLMKALNDLTQGGLATMAPDRVERTVRVASATAKRAGVSLDAMAGLMAQTAGYAEGLGLDRSFGAEAATRALGFGAALGDVGRLDVAAFGRGTKAEYTLLDARLRTNAANSRMAKSVAAMARFEDEMGGRLHGRARTILDAARAGDISMVAPLDPGEMMRAMVEGGMSADTARLLMEDREGTQAAIQRLGLADVVRRAQPAEARRVAEQGFRATIQGRLLARGMGQAQAEAAAARAADAAAKALFSAGREVTADDAKRRDLLAGAMRGALAGTGATEQDLRELGVLGYAEFGRGAERTLGMGAQKALDVFNARALDQERTRRAQVEQDAAMERALSSLGRAGPMARLVGILRNPTIDPKTGKMDLAADVARFLGGVPAGDLGKALADAATAGQLQGASAQARVLALSQGVQAAAGDFERARAAGDKGRIAEVTARVEAMAGGDRAAADASLRALLQRSGLKESDVDAVISGRKRVDPLVRDQVRGLVAARGGNLNATAAEAGVAVASRVTAQDAAGAADQMAYARGLADKLAGLSGDARSRQLDTARQAFRSGLDRAAATVDAALGDEGSLAALGAGGLDLAKRARARALEMEAIAGRQGKTVEELLTSEAPSGPEAEARRELRRRHDALWADVGRMKAALADPRNARHTLAPGEKEAFAKFRESELSAEGQAGRNKAALRDILRRLHAADVPDETLGELAASIGTGAQGDRNLAGLEAGADAAAALDAGGPMSADRRRYLERTAGALSRIGAADGRHAGDDLATARGAIRDFLKATAGEGGEKKGEMKITGRVTIDRDGTTLTYTNTTGTPVVGLS